MIAAELKQELDLRILVCTYWTLPDVAKSFAEILEKQSNVRHAGEAETSMLLHLNPFLFSTLKMLYVLMSFPSRIH